MLSGMLSPKKEPQIKLNKETLDAYLSQKEQFKGIKRDQMISLYKLLDNKFSEEEYEEFEKVFNSFDPDQMNEMPISQLGTALRIMQQLPTENEINQLAAIINPKKPEGQGNESQKKKPSMKKSGPASGKRSGATTANPAQPEEEKIDYFKFLHAIGIYFRNPAEIADEIKQAFRVLDRNKQGYIMAAELREFLSRLGDCLTDEEIDEMIRIADTESNGRINYEQFVDYMTELKVSKKKKKGKGKGKKKKK